jgi:hypothetical protein
LLRRLINAIKRFELQASAFDIEKEAWNKYEIADNALLRTRVILVKMLQRLNEKDTTKMDYTAEGTTITDVEPLHGFNLYGQPSDHMYAPQEITTSTSIEVNYKIIVEDWNSYRLDDGTKIRTRLVLAPIRRLLDKYDSHGIPIYNISSATLITRG